MSFKLSMEKEQFSIQSVQNLYLTNFFQITMGEKSLEKKSKYKT